MSLFVCIRRDAQKEKELIEKKLARLEAARTLDVTALQVCDVPKNAAPHDVYPLYQHPDVSAY